MKIAQYFAFFHRQIVRCAVFHGKDIVCFLELHLGELSSLKTTFGVYMYSM